ncbi:acyl-CoA dehydrogenase family protein [Paremcibacter congregatus]|uniref:3-sulfinopropanoyl-CoA desulfinase n=1 Tax=Paremcibacter congregatus TaxID=2043170 RepID=A0A2G4YU01_9PROT|nr:acyl-CoA dehydrogenase family protein [Paremcibacter congregatus]PHZ85808.1 acyl-CoA dehydrogenase [Paremcibacter congregatus]QDE26771.1 acyl-CoA dehydrogenase [Paremcibacter congregatus]
MMLTEEQEMIRDMARDFAQKELAPRAAEWDKNGNLPMDVLHQMGQLGLMGMTIPEQWGGAETDYVSYALALMEIAGGDGGVSTIMSVNNAPVCAAILKEGSDAQKEKFLKPLARGEMIGAFCLTEPQAGSDASMLKCRARKTDDGWVINGTKLFITSGKIGGAALIFAVTDPDKGKKGISAFLVPTDLPGFTVASVEEKLGQKSSDTCTLVFEDMAVSKDMLLGEENNGYRVALANLETGRIGIAAQSVGMARAALNHAITYANERTSFGKTIIQHQAVGFRLADMATKLEAAQLLVLNAASLKDQGKPCLTEACMAKLFASETAEEVCSAALQTLGGYGYLKDFPIERIYRDVRVCQIYEGTSDIQRMIINRSMIEK